MEPFGQTLRGLCFVGRFLNEAYRVDQGSEEFLCGIGSSVDITAPGQDACALVRNAELGEIGKHTKPLSLDDGSKSVTQVGPINNLGRNRLRKHRLITYDPESDIVSLWIGPPMIKGQHGKHPDSPAHALDTDIFSIQIRRGFDHGVNDESTREFIDQARDKNRIEPSGIGAERSAGYRAIVKLRLTCRKCGQAYRATAHMNELYIQAIFAKETLIVGNKKRTFSFAETPKGNDGTGGGRCRFYAYWSKRKKQKEANDCKDHLVSHAITSDATTAHL